MLMWPLYDIIVIQYQLDFQLFTLKTMQTLCAADSIIKEVIESSTGLNVSQLKPLPYSFNLPYYTMCLNFFKPSNSCEMLNADEYVFFFIIFSKFSYFFFLEGDGGILPGNVFSLASVYPSCVPLAAHQTLFPLTLISSLLTICCARQACWRMLV